MKITIQKPSADSSKGSILLYASSSYIIENFNIYDDTFITFLLVHDELNSSNTLYIKKPKYGKIINSLSSSLSSSGIPISVSGNTSNNWDTGSNLIFGSTSSLNRFTLQEIRYWNDTILDEVLSEHALSPNSYYSNTDTGSFYDLSLRIPLIDKFDISVTQSIRSEHPDYTKSTLLDGRVLSASFYNFDISNFEGVNETHYIVNPSIGNSSIFSDKIIIDTSNTFSDIKHLDKNVSVESGSYNQDNVNNNKIGIYFSPQNIINEDIFKHCGYFRLDDYIGNPLSIYKSSYPDLVHFSKEYWKKYQDKNNISEFIKLFSLYDFSIFNQINQTLPERSNKILGLLIEPNILERNRIKSIAISRINTHHDISIDAINPETVTGAYNTVTSSVSCDMIYNLFGEYNQYSFDIDGVKNYYASSQYIFNDLLFITSSGNLQVVTGSYTINGIQPFISQSFESKYKVEQIYNYSSSLHEMVKIYYSSSYKMARVQDYTPKSIWNLKYAGCKITETDINVNSNSIYQNKPVVEVITVDSGELIVSEYDSDGNFDVF